MDDQARSMTMASRQAPALSVILLGFDQPASLDAVLSCLQAQSLRERIEIVIVVPRDRSFPLDPWRLEGFHRVQVHRSEPITAIGPAYAAGIRAATAPIVALAEDHCFPEPAWAEALLAAYRPEVAAVGPCLRNANPGNAVSWADMLLAYGPWLAPAAAGEVPFLPGHNSSYRRSILLAYGEALDGLIDQETVLHWDLRRRGHRLWLEPKAVAAHTNFGTLIPWLPVQFRCGRRFAAARAGREAWSLARRLLYGLAAPLIPAVRFQRLQRQLAGRPATASPLPRGSRVMAALGLVVDALGQGLGYVGGSGRDDGGFLEAETGRPRWLGSSGIPAALKTTRPGCRSAEASPADAGRAAAWQGPQERSGPPGHPEPKPALKQPGPAGSAEGLERPNGLERPGPSC